MSGVSGNLVQARVRLAGTSASQSGNESGAAFVTSDSWSETAITFNNKPTSGTLFAQWVPVTGQPVTFSVTPFVTDALIGDGTLSLRVFSTGDYGGAGNVSYASREHATAANRPQLILTLENFAPTIADIADRTIAVNTNTGPIAFTVGDGETGAASLTLSRSSSNTALIPTSAIVFGGSGANRTVTVTPAANTLGSATITVTASDGSLTASDTFVVTVTGTAIETWRFANFGTTANAGTAADTANPDGDVWTNAHEYILGTNPTTVTASAILSASRTGTNVVLTFLATQASGAGYSGLTRFYDVETTTTLTNAASWTGLPGYTNIAGANQSVTVTQPITAGPRFYRLRVRLQ